MGKGDIAKDCLKCHNKYRKKHGVSKLKLSSDLSKHAQKWAEHLVEVGSLSHNTALYKGDRLGENVAMKRSSNNEDYSGEEVVKQWYSEVKEYEYSSGVANMKAGHFTQVVWKSSAELGIGMAKKDGRCVVVANYKPAGNFVGHYKDNVLPPTKTDSSSSDSDSDGKGQANGAKSSKDGASSRTSASVPGQSEKVHTSTTTSTSSTGVVKKTITTTRTITFPDGSVKTTTEEKTEEGPASDHGGAQARLSHMKIADAPSSASSHAASAKSQTPKQFADSALQTHNILRKKHSAAPLSLAKDLTDYAQKWADHLAKLGNLEHSEGSLGGDVLGENVASKWSSAGADYTGEEVTNQWYSEESKYDYSGKSDAGSSGHFSQVVWKGSKEMGIGKALDGKGRVFVAASYRPAGNYVGQFKDNVGRP